MHARNSFKNQIFWKDYQKALKKLIDFFFRTQSLLIDKVIKNKRGLKLVTSCSSGHKLVQKNSFICYILSDHVWWCHVKQFLSYSKNYICKFMQDNSWHLNYSTSICPLNLESVESKGKNYKNLNISRTKRAFSMK